MASRGVDLRCVRKREKTGYFVLMTPNKKARKALTATMREIVANSGALTSQEVITQINAVVAGQLLPNAIQSCLQRKADHPGGERLDRAHTTQAPVKAQYRMTPMR